MYTIGPIYKKKTNIPCRRNPADRSGQAGQLSTHGQKMSIAPGHVWTVVLRLKTTTTKQQQQQQQNKKQQQKQNKTKKRSVNALGCRLTNQGQAETNTEAWFNIALRPRQPEGSLGRTAQDGHLDSHTAPEL